MDIADVHCQETSVSFKRRNRGEDSVDVKASGLSKLECQITC